MMNYFEHIFMIVVLAIITIGLVIVVILTLSHWPKYRLDQLHVQKIKQFGLMHFTLKENVPDILQNGLQPNIKKSMSFLEKNMVWMYIADPETYEKKLLEIHSKGDRAAYDVVIFFRDILDEDIDNMRWRKKPEAIVHVGAFKTTCMRVEDV